MYMVNLAMDGVHVYSDGDLKIPVHRTYQHTWRILE
jgi:hypothetical protein